MFKSVFSRFFFNCMLIVLLAFAVLSTLFLGLSARYFQDEKYSLLYKSVLNASRITVSDYEENEQRINTRVMMASYTILARAVDAEIFLVDVQGQTLLCTEQPICQHQSYILASAILKQADQEGMYHEMGTLGGIYAEQYYTVGVPIILSNGTTIGYLFSSTSSTNFVEFWTNTLRIFAMCMFVVLLFSFVILYFITRRLVKPLAQMTAAAQSFSNGDFQSRVAVTSSDEIGQLGLAFNRMADSLSIAENMRRSFIANVSHELKTPMTTISGFVDGILDGTIPPEQHNQYLEIVSNETKRLSRLVRSMLDLGRIEAGEMALHKQNFDINETVCRTIFSFEKKIEEKHLEVRGLDSPKVMVDADPDLIHQVIYNLVDNAVKFVNDGGYLQVEYQVQNKQVVVHIKNSGQGIPQEEIGRVFERFYKSDRSRSLDKNGVGLGLHIVQSIVQLHGGNIYVRSVEGEFCEFIFTLPAGKTPPRLRNKEKDKNGERPSLPEKE